MLDSHAVLWNRLNRLDIRRRKRVGWWHLTVDVDRDRLSTHLRNRA